MVFSCDAGERLQSTIGASQVHVTNGTIRASSATHLQDWCVAWHATMLCHLVSCPRLAVEVRAHWFEIGCYDILLVVDVATCKTTS
eukprot:10653688-Alexandrium_andersonii.AAC.1